jgi:hypothetical protein
MDTHIYAERKQANRVSIATEGDAIKIMTTRYDPETGQPVQVASEPVKLDDLYARRTATERDLASLNELIADAEAQLGVASQKG